MCSGIGASLAAKDAKKVLFPEPFAPIRPYLNLKDRSNYFTKYSTTRKECQKKNE